MVTLDIVDKVLEIQGLSQEESAMWQTAARELVRLGTLSGMAFTINVVNHPAGVFMWIIVDNIEGSQAKLTIREVPSMGLMASTDKRSSFVSFVDKQEAQASLFEMYSMLEEVKGVPKDSMHSFIDKVRADSTMYNDYAIFSL